MHYRIFVLCPNPSDGTSWWRILGPLSELAKDQNITGEKIKLTLWRTGRDETPKWSDLIGHDILLIQRPYSPAALAIVDAAHDMGLKVWVDHDDDLINVPISNKSYKTYADPEVKQAIGKILTRADVVTVSTETLESLFSPMNENTILIPNATSETIYERPCLDRPNSKQILWRGSRTHDEDILVHIDAMVQVAEENPEWRWIFMGEPYFVAYERMPKNRTLFVDGIPMPRYFKVLQKQVPEIGIVPLADNKFNRSKSNIAWQEMTSSGAAVLAPNWDGWRNPGATLYDAPDVDKGQSFYQALTGLVRNSERRRSLAQESVDALEKDWMLAPQNARRLALIRSLVGVTI